MAEAAVSGVEAGRPSGPRLVWIQARYANRSFRRTPIAAFFTIIFPLIFLVLLSALIGNVVVDQATGLRLAQFLTPAIAAFAATTASFTSLAIGLAVDRDEGILKRVRGTPIPPSLFMAGRIGSTVWIAFLAVVLMVVVGVAFFGVDIVWRYLPAALLTLAVGIGSFAALGLVVVAVSPTQAATQALTNAIILPLAFISDVFVQSDEMPEWLQTLGWIFPLKHFANALGDTFNPYLEASPFAWDHLAVMAAWGIAGLIVARLLFRWEPRRSGGAQAPARAPSGAATSRAVRLRAVEDVGRPGPVQMLVSQAGYGMRKIFRNTLSVFFVIAFPVILLALLPTVFGNEELPFRGGVLLTQFLTPVLAVFGAAVAGYADFSERVAQDRDQGVLKRLAGTPVPPWAYMSGRIIAAVAVAVLSLVLTVVVGVILYDVDVVWRALPGLLVTVLLGVGCFTALGLALAAIAPNAEAVPAIANATLLPLSFFSDIFLIGELPDWMNAVGWVFPLKHVANAVADAFNPTVSGVGLYPDHLAVMAAWAILGVVVASLRWTWVPRTSGGGGRRRRRGADAG